MMLQIEPTVIEIVAACVTFGSCVYFIVKGAFRS